MRPIWHQLGWSNSSGLAEDYDSTLLRPLVIDLLCNLGDAECLKTVAAKFNAWQTSGHDIVPDLRVVAYCHGMAQVSDFSTWNWMLDRYKVQ